MPRDLRLDFAGRSYRWFDVDEMATVHGTSLAPMLTEDVMQYFKVPLEYQVLCDAEGPLVRPADLRRLLDSAAPRLWLFDARHIGSGLRSQCERRLAGLPSPQGAAGSAASSADADAGEQVLLPWAAAWRKLGPPPASPKEGANGASPRPPQLPAGHGRRELPPGSSDVFAPLSSASSMCRGASGRTGRQQPPTEPLEVAADAAPQPAPRSPQPAPRSPPRPGGAGSAPSSPLSRLVTVELSKTDVRHQVFGFTNVPEVEPDGRVALRVTEVSPDGLLAEWNAKHPRRRVRPGDRIISVNGVHSSLAQMRGLLCGHTVRLGVERAIDGGDLEDRWPGACWGADLAAAPGEAAHEDAAAGASRGSSRSARRDVVMGDSRQEGYEQQVGVGVLAGRAEDAANAWAAARQLGSTSPVPSEPLSIASAPPQQQLQQQGTLLRRLNEQVEELAFWGERVQQIESRVGKMSEKRRQPDQVSPSQASQPADTPTALAASSTAGATVSGSPFDSASSAQRAAASPSVASMLFGPGGAGLASPALGAPAVGGGSPRSRAGDQAEVHSRLLQMRAALADAPPMADIPELGELHRLREVLRHATEKKELEIRRWQQHEEQMADQVEAQRREIDELRGWRQRAQIEAAEALIEEKATRARQDAERWKHSEESMAMKVSRQRTEIEELQRGVRHEAREVESEKRARESLHLMLRSELTSKESVLLQECTEASAKESRTLQEWRDFQSTNAARELAVKEEVRAELRLHFHEELREVQAQFDGTQRAFRQELEVSLEREETLRDELQAVALTEARLREQYRTAQDSQEMAQLVAEEDHHQLELEVQELQFSVAVSKQQLSRYQEQDAFAAMTNQALLALERPPPQYNAKAFAPPAPTQSQWQVAAPGPGRPPQFGARDEEDRMKSLLEDQRRELQSQREEIRELLQAHRASQQLPGRTVGGEREMALVEVREMHEQEVARLSAAMKVRAAAAAPAPAAAATTEAAPPAPQPATEPAPQAPQPTKDAGDYVASQAGDELDVALERCVQGLGAGCLKGVPLVRVGKTYKFGTKKVMLRLDGEVVKVRNGSSFVPFAEWLQAELSAASSAPAGGEDDLLRAMDAASPYTKHAA